MLAKYLVVWVTTSVFLISTAAATEWSQRLADARIYIHGGRPVELGEFPFLVWLLIIVDDGLNACTGSIPSATTVLTSAHCSGHNIAAYAGLVNGKEKKLGNDRVQVRRVESQLTYSFYDLYDIMVCYVDHPWVWTEFVAPVALQLGEGSLQPSFVVNCQVMGFGATEEDGDVGVAHVMDQLVGSSLQCRPKFLFFCSFFMCSINVKSKTICQGDSGGPVICGGRQWAINMATGGMDSVEDCLPPQESNVYVYIDSFRSFIRRSIKDLPSSADSIQRWPAKISMYQAVLYQPLGLILVMTVELLNS